MAIKLLFYIVLGFIVTLALIELYFVLLRIYHAIVEWTEKNGDIIKWR